MFYQATSHIPKPTFSAGYSDVTWWRTNLFTPQTNVRVAKSVKGCALLQISRLETKVRNGTTAVRCAWLVIIIAHIAPSPTEGKSKTKDNTCIRRHHVQRKHNTKDARVYIWDREKYIKDKRHNVCCAASYEPKPGLEPGTYSLRMNCSTNWAISAFSLCGAKLRRIFE